MFKSFFKKDPAVEAGETLYAAAVRQARAPALYAGLGVPDTVEGRFEMVALHVFLILRRIKSDAPAARKVGQKMFDAMFQNMDDSLRELGVGDLSVGKRVRKLAENFYGRVAAYEDAIRSGSDEALAQALGRNVFLDPDASSSRPLAAYARRVVAAIDEQSRESVMSGEVSFPPVEDAP